MASANEAERQEVVAEEKVEIKDLPQPEQPEGQPTAEQADAIKGGVLRRGRWFPF